MERKIVTLRIAALIVVIIGLLTNGIFMLSGQIVGKTQQNIIGVSLLLYAVSLACLSIVYIIELKSLKNNH